MKELYESSILLLKSIMKEAEERGLVNSQEFLDWEDTINEISVKY